MHSCIGTTRWNMSHFDLFLGHLHYDLGEGPEAAAVRVRTDYQLRCQPRLG